jgi:RHH-type proline utilization regulon transcriptional repressor/proline dehydrogenase/delta 1-pyrroline-5-carboxylate dehydrogenase
MGPLIRRPDGPLLDALEHLGPGEEWLVRPTRLDADGYAWTPGVKVGVQPGSPFHLTECFGPVLGVMRAADLDEAIRWQNQPAYGLTAGLHALDPSEIARWRDAVRAGNLYVNRGITGAVVARQPFGGWKRSVVGPGAKAGGPQYVASLGRWPADDGSPHDRADYEAAGRAAWDAIRRPVDVTGLRAESNALRYRPLGPVIVGVGPGVAPTTVERAVLAGRIVGAVPEVVAEADVPARLGGPPADKLRLLGAVSDATRRAAIDAGAWIDDQPVAADPAREILRWAREQAVSETRHRHGNLTGRRPGLVPVPSRRAGGADRGVGDTGHRRSVRAEADGGS